MGKRDKKNQDGLTYTTLTLASVALAAAGAAVFLPMWRYAPMNPATEWPERNIGLFKVSGKYTNIMLNPADLAWMQVKDQTCGAYMSRAGMMGASAKNMANSLISAAAGATCPLMCVRQLEQRCKMYKGMVMVNYLTAALVVTGPLLSLVAGIMPLVQKEKKADKYTNMSLAIGGAACCALGVMMYAGFTCMMYANFNKFGLYPTPDFGVSFFIAVGATLLLVGAMLPAVKKVQDLEAPAGEANLAYGYDPGMDPMMMGGMGMGGMDMGMDPSMPPGGMM